MNEDGSSPHPRRGFRFFKFDQQHITIRARGFQCININEQLLLFLLYPFKRNNSRRRRVDGTRLIIYEPNAQAYVSNHLEFVQLTAEFTNNWLIHSQQHLVLKWGQNWGLSACCTRSARAYNQLVLNHLSKDTRLYYGN